LPDELQETIRACPGRLYNTYDDGGYLIWFVREKPVFMDSRQDPFPSEIVRDHILVEKSGNYDTLFGRYDIGCALTVQGTPLAARLARDGWRRESSAKGWALFSRPKENGRFAAFRAGRGKLRAGSAGIHAN
jgi:hypothetical protein